MANSTAVTRHLNYAWVEFGHSGDGQAFSVGLDSLGWKNLVRHLPRKSDGKGAYYVDSAHELLPIRWKGRCRMVLPNSVKDTKKYPKPYIVDPLFDAHRAANGDDGFRKEMKKICEFLSQWVFTPGIKGDPTSQGELTLGSDATDYADLVACSGHGCSGLVWGGDSSLGCRLADALEKYGAPTHSDRLKYVLIPTCYNLSAYNKKAWVPALRRANPVHGVFGYHMAYPGGEPGRQLFQKFANYLKYNGGRMSILEAFKKAHAGWLKDRWGAIIHTSSKADTMRDWLKGNLATPATDGEIRWFCQDNWPDGEVVTFVPQPYSVHYYMGTTKITAANTQSTSVGLFAGEAGKLQISKTSGTFGVGDDITLMFFYYRPEKSGMDLTKLLKIGTPTNATVTPVTDENKDDGSANVDALKVTITKPGLSTVDIPFTVHPQAHEHYAADGQNAYGYFWIKLKAGYSTECPSYPDGAWLRVRT